MFHVMTVLDVYKGILEGKLSRFDFRTWKNNPHGKDNFILCFRYLILDRLKWDMETTQKNITEMEIEFFKMWNLRTPIEKYYKYNYNRAIKESFPEWF